jgi:DNA-directed RNA polymerase subunit H (RpoH/RPB5)
MASQNISSLISQIYKSRNVILELMGKQGYNISEYEGFSVNEVNTMKTNNQLDMILEKKQASQLIENPDAIGDAIINPEEVIGNNRKIYIKYYLAKALRPNNLQEMIDDLFMVEEVLTKNDTLLVVVKDEVNETMINTVKHIWESEKIFIILQPLKRLQFNILSHILVPSHRILKEQEKISIKQRYNIMQDFQFPELSRFDPVAQAIGIRPGEVCEIIRSSKTAILAPYYRICM